MPKFPHVVAVVERPEKTSRLATTKPDIKCNEETGCRSLPDSDAAGHLVVDIDGTIIALSATAATLLAVKPNETTGQTIYDFVPGHGRTEFKKALQRAIHRRAGNIFEIALLRKDGVVHDAVVAIRGIDHPGNETLAYITLVDCIGCDFLKARTRSAEGLQRILNAVSDWYIAFDLSGRIIDSSPSLQDLLGYTEGELFRLSIQELTGNPNGLTEAKRFSGMHKTSGRSTAFREQLIRRNKSVVQVEVRALYIPEDADAVPEGVVLVGRDLTSSLAMESAERLHQEILHSIAEGIQMTRIADGIIVYANSTFERIFGYGLGELAGRPMHVLNAPGPNSPELIAREISTRVIEEGSWYGELRNIRKDRSLFWTRATVTRFEHPVYGSVLLAVQSDVTEQIELQLALAAEWQHVRTAVNSADLALWSWDVASGNLTLDRRCYTILGYQVGEVPPVYDAWADICHPDDHDEVLKYVVSLLKGDHPYLDIQFRFRHADTHWVRVLLRGRVVERGLHGEARTVAGTMLDLSSHVHRDYDRDRLMDRIEALLGAGAGKVIAAESVAETPREDAMPVRAKLTPRQIQVLGLIAEGHTSAKIADILHISEATIVVHRRDIMGKLDLHSIAELTRYAIQHGLTKI